MDLGEALYTTALVVTVWATVVCAGIAASPRDVKRAVSRRSVVIPVLLLDVVGVPLVVWALSRLLGLAPDAATGVILVAAAAGGPLGFKLVELARGDQAFAVALVVVLQIADVVCIPVVTSLLLPRGVAPPVADVVRSVLVFIVLPLAVGWAARAVLPYNVDRVVRTLTRMSTVGLAIVVLLVLVRDLPELAAIAGSGVPVVAVTTILGTMLAAWVIARPDRPTRMAAAFVTGVRANALALAIAATVFAATPGVGVAVVVYGLLGVAVPSAIAFVASRRSLSELHPIAVGSDAQGV